MQGRIRAVYDMHKGRYGYRRITATLSKSMAEPVNHKCVQRLMRKMGLRSLIRAKKAFSKCARHKRCARAKRPAARLLRYGA